MTPVVDPSGSATGRKEVTAAREFRVAVEVGEYSAFESELSIVAQANQEWYDVSLNCLCLNALVWATLCLVSFWALGKKFWLFVRNWVFVGGWGKCVFLGILVSPNRVRRA